MLAASMAPSAAPAPMIECSSSIKRIQLSSAVTSSRIPLRRSSKSPRYFVPAIRLVRSRLMSRRCASSLERRRRRFFVQAPRQSLFYRLRRPRSNRGCSCGADRGFQAGVRSPPPARDRGQAGPRRRVWSGLCHTVPVPCRNPSGAGGKGLGPESRHRFGQKKRAPQLWQTARRSTPSARAIDIRIVLTGE